MTVGLGLAANALVLLGAWLLAGHGLRQRAGLDRVLGSSVVALSWILLGLEVLGSAGLLRIGPLFLWAGVLPGGGMLAYRLSRARAVAPGAATASTERWSRSSWLALTLVVWTAGILLVRTLLMPVRVVSDGPIYHLYFAARWWRAGRLFLVASPFGESAATYFPANGDLWFTWLITTWGGERLAKAGQAPFLLLAGLASWGLARLLGAGRNASLIASCWFVSSTPLILFSFEANVDTIFVAGYLIAAYFCLRWLMMDDEGWPSLVLGGLAAGIALGTKPVGVVFVPPLVLLVLGAAVVRRGSRGKALTQAVLLLLTSILLTSGFWYGRNLLLTGNPLYPLHLRVLGRTLLQGWYGQEAMRHSPYFLPVTDWRALVDTLLAVSDPRLAPLWVAAIAGAWCLPGARNRTREPWVWALAALSVLNVALYWVLIPYRTQQRFMLQALGLAVVPLARLFDRGRWLAMVGAGLLGLHLVTPQTWPATLTEARIPWDMTGLIPNMVPGPLGLLRVVERPNGPALEWARIPALALLLAAGGGAGLAAGSLGLMSQRAGRYSRRWIGAAAGILVLLTAAALETGTLGLDSRQLFYPPFRDYYAGWAHLETRSGAAGSRVAYAGTNIPFYLMGSGLRNDVRYVNINAHRDWQMHDYHRAALRGDTPSWPNSRPGWDRAHPDPNAWLANLRAAGIQLLAVARVNPAEGPHNVADPQSFPIERQWADSRPDIFQPLYGVHEQDPYFRLYRLRPSS